MSYVKQNFVDGEVLNASKLNHMEDGIGDAYVKPSDGIPSDDIADEAISTEKIASGAIAKEVAVTIPTTGWTSVTDGYYKDVTVSSVSATSTVIVAPAPSFFDKWGECKLKATELSTNTIRFECETIPDEALTVNVLIFKVDSET